MLSTQPADHSTDDPSELLPDSISALEVLVFISKIMRDYTNECKYVICSIAVFIYSL